jgi:hypothetical protein
MRGLGTICREDLKIAICPNACKYERQLMHVGSTRNSNYFIFTDNGAGYSKIEVPRAH